MMDGTAGDDAIDGVTDEPAHTARASNGGMMGMAVPNVIDVDVPSDGAVVIGGNDVDAAPNMNGDDDDDDNAAPPRSSCGQYDGGVNVRGVV